MPLSRRMRLAAREWLWRIQIATSRIRCLPQVDIAADGGQQPGHHRGAGAQQLPDRLGSPGDIQQRDGQQIAGGHRVTGLLPRQVNDSPAKSSSGLK